MPPWPTPRRVRASTLVAIPQNVRAKALQARKEWWDEVPAVMKEGSRTGHATKPAIQAQARRRMRIRFMRHGVAFPWEAPQMPMWHMWSPLTARTWDMNPIIRGKKIEEGMSKMPDLIAEYRESRRGFRKDKRDQKVAEKQREKMEKAASYNIHNLRRLIDHYDESDFAWRDHFNLILHRNPLFQLPKEVIMTDHTRRLQKAKKRWETLSRRHSKEELEDVYYTRTQTRVL